MPATHIFSSSQLFRGAGVVTSVTATSPLFSSGGTTPNITIQRATTTQSGYIAPQDFNSFKSTYLFQPGGVAGAGGNTYTTWDSLYADFALGSGCRTIVVDDSIAPAHVPNTQPYDLENAFLYGSPGSVLNPVLIFDNGATLSKLPVLVSFNLLLRSVSNSPVFSASTGAPTIFLDIGAGLDSAGSAEFFHVSGGVQFVLLLDRTAIMQFNAYEVFNLVGNSQLFCILGSLGAVTAETIRDDGTGVASFVGIVPSFTVDSSQPNFTGTLSIVSACPASEINYDNTSGELAARDVQAAITELARHRVYSLGNQLASAQSVNAAETDLALVTTGTALNFDEMLDFTFRGTFAANINAKTVRIYVNGTVCYTTTALILNGGNYSIRVQVIASSTPATQGIVFVTCLSNNATLTPVTMTDTIVSANFSTDFTVKITGQGVTTGDIIQRIVEPLRVEQAP